ncbi:MAG: tRNA (N6-threonylcarbamoyladenosine(37)-N6)-methyltransferase TrmO [Nitriliruptoraceae bacterium]
MESPLRDPADAPKQGDEAAGEAWLVLDEAVHEGFRDVEAGSEIVVLTWLHLARRDTLVVHPRGDPEAAERGVFSTRSPARPNPIGLHRVGVVAVEGTRIRVRNLEAVDGTPVLDIKPVAHGAADD